MALLSKEGLLISPMPSSPEQETMMKACRKLCREYINKHLAEMNPLALATLIGMSIVKELLQQLPQAIKQAANELELTINAETEIESNTISINLTGFTHKIPIREIDEKSITR